MRDRSPAAAKRRREPRARAGGPGLRVRFSAYLRSNAQVALASLGRISAAPLSSLMTAAVIGIALALPTGLFVLLQNLQNVSGGWDGAAQVSLFLKLDVDNQRAQALAGELQQRPEINSIRTLTREQAMAEFQELSGFGDALDVLEENPLPPVLIVRPDKRHSDPESVRELVEKLRALPEADLAQLDLQWVKRLYTIMEIGQRGVMVVAALLALAVLLIVGNTIRLDIENRRDEIVITKLIGATNAFIRRPFLYSGIWYGLLGGIIAWLLIQLSLGVLAGPVHRLAGLYGSSFTLTSLDLSTSTALLGSSAALGLVGSWLAVGRHLNAIEPT